MEYNEINYLRVLKTIVKDKIREEDVIKQQEKNKKKEDSTHDQKENRQNVGYYDDT